MSDDDTARLPPIDKKLRDEVREEVKEIHGTLRGNYREFVENALRNHLDGSNGGDVNDRLRRLENAVEDIQETTEATYSEVGRKTKEDSDVGPKTKNRLQKIENRLNREADGDTVHGAVIRTAIEDIAGGSRPTVKRYMEMLQERQIVFENPNPNFEDRFFKDFKPFVECVLDYAENGVITWDEVEEIESQYPTDKWDPVEGNFYDDHDTHDRTFQ